MRDWHPEDIKASVRKRGLTLSGLSKSNNLPRQALSLALVRPWAEAEKVIAAAIGIAPAKIWPSRYDTDGRRKAPQPAANRTRLHRSAGARA